MLEKYLANSCSYEELSELLQLVSDNADEHTLHSAFQVVWHEAGQEESSSLTDSMALYRILLQREAGPGRRRRLRRTRRKWVRSLVFAGLLVLLVGAGVMLAQHSRVAVPIKTVVMAPKRFKNDVKPGGERAVLVLSNGQTIVLDSAGTGTLAVQGGMKVVKLNNGQLVYRTMTNGGDSLPVYNTISTPRGGQYELVLQDGTKVWLNSESSLRYPTVFTGKERSVELSGEAYFEVAPHAAAPFRVFTLDQSAAAGKERREILVLGTAFNVMAYEEEKVVRTTLLEGTLRVGDGVSNNLLRAGEQAEWQARSPAPVRITEDADVDAAVAWKNGFFSFDRSDIHTIMRQLSRWYDLKVTYNNNGVGKGKVFWGGIQRNLPLSDVLRILEKSGVEFSVDGNQVTVDM